MRKLTKKEQKAIKKSIEDYEKSFSESIYDMPISSCYVLRRNSGNSTKYANFYGFDEHSRALPDEAYDLFTSDKYITQRILMLALFLEVNSA